MNTNTDSIYIARLTKWQNARSITVCLKKTDRYD